MSINRRDFVKSVVGYTAFSPLLSLVNIAGCSSKPSKSRPNIILCMSDDQGWGDTGYNCHPNLKTPVLDEMAATGLRFDRFYSAAPVCSPTRGSVMTGRHPNRFGCISYNFAIRPEEITIAEALKKAGYTTGHFGKWHIGSVKPDSPVNPAKCGFDEYLANDNFFDLDPPLSRNGQEPKNYEGESSEVIIDEAIKFIKEAHKSDKPFLTVIWLGSPHLPYEALPEDKKIYEGIPEDEQNYLAEITAMDSAIGKLRTKLRQMAIADNTILWFCSDNGAYGPGSTGGLRGKKITLWEGGIRVPAIIEWPKGIPEPVRTDIPCFTSDIYPTIMNILGCMPDNQIKPLDGISLKPLINGNMNERPKPIHFWDYPFKLEEGNTPYMPPEAMKGWWRTFRNFKHPLNQTDEYPGHAVIMDNRYKLHKLAGGYELYDIVEDSAESKNIAAEWPGLVTQMKEDLKNWQKSVDKSMAGFDYN